MSMPLNSEGYVVVWFRKIKVSYVKIIFPYSMTKR